MSFFQAIYLGIIQGLTEFIPVSSSGHLVLTQYFWGIGENSSIVFELFMHLGTLLAVVVYFRSMLWDLLKSLFSWKNTMNQENHRKNRNIVLYLFIATLGTGIVYSLFGASIKHVYDLPGVVAALLIVTGTIVFASDYLKDGGIPASSMGFWRSIIIGISQGFAILPGISRSGTTIAASLATGIKRRDAAHFSFLLSVPAILAANLSEYKSFMKLDASSLYSYLAGFVSAFVVGYFVISFLIRLIESSHLKYFAYYCWFIGVLSLLIMAF
ncbi:MAG: undecaprenyl-diphosphate phosphatase [Candidatus Cloacimonetes bacterium]|nr:undecaprenyl-diphosphate phosphatase [Candidatus Cloacimonadota bacterium]